MIPPPPRSTLFPYTTLFRSKPRMDLDNLFGDAEELLLHQLRLLEWMDTAGRKRIVDDTPPDVGHQPRSEEHTSELQSHSDLVCRLLLEKKKNNSKQTEKTRH